MFIKFQIKPIIKQTGINKRLISLINVNKSKIVIYLNKLGKLTNYL